MKQNKAGRIALFAAGAALILGTAACSNEEAEQKAYKADEAKHQKAQADQKAMRRVGYAVECLSAMRWKRAFLGGAGVGSVDLYVAHYRDQLLKALGDNSVPAADGAPELTKASVDPYLDWAYDNDVKTKFTAGRDFDKDGTVSPREADAQGNSRVTACIQQAAELGVGPLAGKDKTGRMYKMEALRARLDAAS
jgi:hypothetical protein